MRKKKCTSEVVMVYWLPFVLWGLLVFLLSSKPVGDTPLIFPDYVLHIAEFGVFAALLYRALLASRISPKLASAWTLTISFLYGIFDEIHQSYVPGRESSLRDIAFDTIGAILAVTILWKLLPKAPRKLQVLAKKLRLL